jgi:hypothetical protein
MINTFHTGLSIYLGMGWMLPILHSKILVGMIPCVFVNWLVDDHKCMITRLEYYCTQREAEHTRSRSSSKSDTNDETLASEYDGFVSTKLRAYGIHMESKDINNILVVIMFHSFCQSYRHVLLS